MPRFFRLVNGADPIPHVPGCDYSENYTCLATPTGYHHAGIEYWFPKGDYKMQVMCDYRECTGRPASEDYSCSETSYSVWDPHPSDHVGYFDVIPNGFCNERPRSSALSARLRESAGSGDMASRVTEFVV